MTFESAVRKWMQGNDPSGRRAAPAARLFVMPMLVALASPVAVCGQNARPAAVDRQALARDVSELSS